MELSTEVTQCSAFPLGEGGTVLRLLALHRDG